MKKEQWFISNPDESQLEVIKTGLSKNLVVVGSAGSGKTNLTLFKAKQADARGDSWGIIVVSRAMRRMISYGLDAIGLNGERVTYSWAWTNRGGFDLRGDLYWEEDNPENIFLVNGNEVSQFRRFYKEYNIKGLDENASKYVAVYRSKEVMVNSDTISFDGSVLSLNGKDIINFQLYKVEWEDQEIFFYIDEKEIYLIKREDSKRLINNCSTINNLEIIHPIAFDGALSIEGGEVINPPLFKISNIGQEEFFLIDGGKIYLIKKKDEEYTIDFSDFVQRYYFDAFRRRAGKYTRVNFEQDKFDLSVYTLLSIPIVLTKKEDKPIDHIFVDEAQDLKIREYEDQYIPRVRENMVFFGDDNQRITSGATMSLIAKCFEADMLHLNYNYRVPKSIARFAQSIMNTDLISSNMKDGGDSDYPKYPKPTLEWYPTLRDILDAIVTQVKLEDLKDVAILIPSSNTGGDKDSCLLLSSWIPVEIDPINTRRSYHYSDIQCIFAYLNSIGVDVMTFYRTQRPSPYRTIDTLDFTNNDLISLLSIDDAKGSEFSHVFVILPSHAGGEVQNEMSYIACTRATESLHLFYYGDYEPALISKQEGSDYNLLDVRSKRPNDYVKPSMFKEDGGILCLDILYSERHHNSDRGNLYLPGDELGRNEHLAFFLRSLNKRESENKGNNGFLD